MELRTLRYFLAVVQEGNITNAAKRLHVTQPTLSRQLADLEKELGRQLYTALEDELKRLMKIPESETLLCEVLVGR